MGTSGNFIAFRWERNPREWLCVVVNYSPQQSQCFVRMYFPELMGGQNVRFQDLLSPNYYDRQGDLLNRGLFLDVPAWGYNVFDVQWLV